MKITCESCGAKYTIADDKVRGRKVKIRCKGCGTPIVVDGQQSMPPNGEASGEPESGVPLDVPAATGDAEWSVNLSDTEQTTLTTQQVVDGWQSGRITADAFVWKEGMDDWVAIQESAELSPLLKGPGGARASADGNGAATKPTLGAAGGASKPAVMESAGGAASSNTASTAAKSAAAARLAGGRAKASTDLFAGVERAGGDEEEVATSAPPVLPKAGIAAQQDDSKLTGARNENSVLFSLDALKAGFSGPPAKAAEPAPAKARGQKAEDPFDLGAPSSVAGIGGGSNALFSLADNQALLTAPAPPEPPPQVVQASLPAGSLPPDPAARRKTLLLAAGGAVGVLALGLALGASMGGGDSSPAAPSATPPAEQRTPDNDKVTAKADEPKPEEPEKKPEPASEAPKEEPKEDAKTEAPAGDTKASPKTDDKPTTSGTKADKPASASPATGSTARKEASKEPKEDAKPAAPSGGAEFSKSAAIGALGAASAQAASCKKIGGPTGSGKVNVTFAPSGRVTSATVNGAPFAGTSVGGCVASVFRKAKVPAFSGSPVTVSKSFSIR